MDRASFRYARSLRARRSLPYFAAAAVLLAGGIWALAGRLEDTWYVPLEHPAIQYAGDTNDPVGNLDHNLESGKIKLDYAPNGWGYLPAILKQLDINPDSQVLVFSRTSIQADRISPRTPRAIYFNDNVSVGYVQNGEVLELTSLDPKQGIILYSMDAERSPRPEFARRDDCLRCHQGPVTLGVPGLLVSSVHPRTGRPGEEHGNAFMTDHRTPFEERWGGWYVTGTHGMQYHLGNNPNLADPLHPGADLRDGTQNVTKLDDRFDTSRYLEPTSDLVALLVLEHQVRMTNLMIRIGWDTRIAYFNGGKVDEARRKELDAEIDEMAGYMLFADEEPLKEPVAGVSSFTKTFPQRGPRDAKGRSLRDFDLKKRLFKYPLSYMIYSAAFDNLPEMARDRVYRRLYDVLTGKDESKTFAHLSADDRRAILEIVRATKPGLPEYWTAREN
jgi:hypothetical protein